MRDDDARRIVLARRARFLAAALVGLGSDACKARGSARRRPGRDGHGDGVPDAEDQCPREPGSAWNTRARGCPCLTIIEPVDVRILAVIAFGNGGAAPSSSIATLDELARVLREHTELTVLVEGHVDDVEAPALALRRAKVVVAALVARGVDARRLRAASLGATPPFAPNDSEAGRAQNRRVTFRVVEGAEADADAGSP